MEGVESVFGVDGLALAGAVFLGVAGIEEAISVSSFAVDFLIFEKCWLQNASARSVNRRERRAHR